MPESRFSHGASTADPRDSAVVSEAVALDTAKADLRRVLRQARRAAPADPDRAARLAEAVVSTPRVSARLAAGGAVAVYASLPHEPPTAELRRRLRRQSVSVFLPVAHPDRRLTWVRDDGRDSTAWGVGARGVPDLPEHSSAYILATAAVIVVPALAATPDGYRLGQGGGYYDTLLAARAEAWTSEQIVLTVVGPHELRDKLPVGTHDARVDAVVLA